MTIFLSGLILLFILINLSGLGYFILNDKKSSNNSLSVNLLFGLSILILFSHFAFFLFKLNSQHIPLIFFLFSFLILLLNFKFNDGFFNHSKKIFLISLPLISIFLFLAFIYGEQYYVFRGNKWDWFAFVTSSFYLNNLDVIDFLNLKDNFSWENFKNYDFEKHSAYHNNIVIWLLRIVNINLLGSFFINLEFNSPFFNLYLFKIFSLVVINISIIDFLKKNISIKDNYLIFFISLVFATSFWTLYLIEADYYRQLISFGFFIYLLTYLDDFFLNFENKKYKRIIVDVFFIYALFLIYPELLFIYLIILLLSYIFYDQKIRFIKQNYLSIIIICIGLIILILPSHELIIKQILGQLQSTTGETRWWTYFGAFLFGRSSPALDIEFANEVKNLIYNTPNVSGGMDNVSLKDIILIITNTINKFNYQTSYLSIIPSISGFYFITDLFKFNEQDFFNIIFLIIFNVYLFYLVFKNLYFILITNDKKSKNLKILLIVFLFFSIFFITFGKLWTFIKFYMYMSPLIFLLILFNFSKLNNDLILKPNLILILLMSSFIIYKYHTNNFGIGYNDSFPSIQKVNMKKNINWKFDINKYSNCKKIYLNFGKWSYYDPKTIPDRFKSIYLTINLLNNGYKFEDNLVLIKNSTKKIDKVCKISKL
jgi:hypothetical protein